MEARTDYGLSALGGAPKRTLSGDFAFSRNYLERISLQHITHPASPPTRARRAHARYTGCAPSAAISANAGSHKPRTRMAP